MPRNKAKILVTGGAGFIGSEFVRQSVQKKYNVIVVDKLTYAGDRARLKEIQGKYKFYKTDICKENALVQIFKSERPDYIVHFAAETHVDRSIHESARPFIETNVKGTQTLIDLALKFKIKKFIHISTDEVYGEITSGAFTEKSPLVPNNPYSATKAAADHLITAAMRTHGFPAMIIRPCNNYGQWQYPEKLIPVIILKALHNQKVPVYGRGQHIREWLHVSDCADAIHFLFKKGRSGQTYNIGSNSEQPNIQTVKKILKHLNKPTSLIKFVKDRPGHDVRYALNYQKLKKLGWNNRVHFQSGLASTVEWNNDNIHWLERKLNYLASYWKKVYQKQ